MVLMLHKTIKEMMMAEAKKTTAKKSTVKKVIPKREVAMTKDNTKYGMYIGAGLVLLLIISSMVAN
jgi:hypothetical protein|tara:strand:- start:455 stop:652 length:198 start_codon:yes stop_codon:yes gene_type:complete